MSAAGCLARAGAITTYRCRAVPADWAVGALAVLVWLGVPAACGLVFQAVMA